MVACKRKTLQRAPTASYVSRAGVYRMGACVSHGAGLQSPYWLHCA